MAKWQYTRAESWRYPSLGFAATFGDVLEADFAPDANWDEVDGGTAATLPPVDTSNFTEPAAGTIPVYNAVTNRAEYKTLAELELLTQTEQDARYVSREQTLTDGIQEYAWTYPQATWLPGASTLAFGAVSADKGDGSADVLACTLAPGTGSVRRVAVGTVLVDDHCAPALSTVDGYRPIVMWSDHNITEYLTYRVGVTPENVDVWGPELRLSFEDTVSYALIYRQPSDPSHVFVFARVLSASGYSWNVIEGDVSETTGVVTWGTERRVLLFGPGEQGYMTGAPDGDLVRFAFYGHPVNSTDHVIRVCEINLETGAITTLGASMSANLDGTGLPLAPYSAGFSEAFDPGSGNTSRLFSIATVAGEPAVACASWATASPSSTYKVARHYSDGVTGLDITSGTGYASTPSAAALNPATLSIRIKGDFGTPEAGTRQLGRKYDGTGNQRSWQFNMLSTGKLRLTWSTDGSATVAADSTVALSGTAQGVGVDFNPDTGSGRSVTFYEYDGATWNTLGTVITGTASTLFGGTADLIVGDAGTTAYQTAIETFTLSAIGGAAVASLDFTAFDPWLPGDAAGTSRDDAEGNTWTLSGSVAVKYDGWFTFDVVAAGDPIGYTAATQYLGGMAFANPALGDVLYLVREDAGTWLLERHARFNGGDYDVTVLATSAIKKSRPMPPVGGGPIELVYSLMSHYGNDYTDYSSDIVAVAR